MTKVSSLAASGSFLMMLVVLAGCASSSVSVPVGTSSLSHDEVMTLLSSATVHRSVPDAADTTMTLTTREDGTVESFYHPGKSRFAHAGKVVHEQGTWTVGPDGRFCVKLTRETTATSAWCRFIFRTGTGFGAGNRPDATSLEKWDISRD
jgi:hypothetical protein